MDKEKYCCPICKKKGKILNSIIIHQRRYNEQSKYIEGFYVEEIHFNCPYCEIKWKEINEL